MKAMTMKTISAACIILVAALASAQDYKVAVSGSDTRLIIHEVNKIEIEGTSGNEIIFSTTARRSNSNERAEGLKAISSLGLEDNSGIGLSVVQKGNEIEVNQISRRSSRQYVVKVPKNVKVFYEHNGVHGSKLYVKNVESELEISTNHSSVWLENITGPTTVNTVHGKIEASFSTLNQTAPTSIVSVHGLVDVALPASTKATLRLDTNWGEIFTDMDVEFDRSVTDMRRLLSTQTVNGTLNGGGVRLNLSSTHNNVYLRKK